MRIKYGLSYTSYIIAVLIRVVNLLILAHDHNPIIHAAHLRLLQLLLLAKTIHRHNRSRRLLVRRMHLRLLLLWIHDLSLNKLLVLNRLLSSEHALVIGMIIADVYKLSLLRRRRRRGRRGRVEVVHDYSLLRVHVLMMMVVTLAVHIVHLYLMDLWLRRLSRLLLYVRVKIVYVVSLMVHVDVLVY